MTVLRVLLRLNSPWFSDYLIFNTNFQNIFTSRWSYACMLNTGPEFDLDPPTCCKDTPTQSLKPKTPIQLDRLEGPFSIRGEASSRNWKTSSVPYDIALWMCTRVSVTDTGVFSACKWSKDLICCAPTQGSIFLSFLPFFLSFWGKPFHSFIFTTASYFQRGEANNKFNKIKQQNMNFGSSKSLF